MILLIEGKSGSGKSALMAELVKKHGYEQIITCTTRQRREGEDKGSYHFMGKEEFMARVHRDEFIEYDSYNGNFYGTFRSELENADKKGKKVCIVTPDGAKAIKKEYPDACVLYLETSPMDSCIRALDREEEPTPKELKNIFVRTLTDQFLYENIDYDIKAENPRREAKPICSIAHDVVELHQKWIFGHAQNVPGTHGNTVRISHDRCLELLDKCISHVMSENDGRAEGVAQLLKIGFTAEELTGVFEFDKEAVRSLL